MPLYDYECESCSHKFELRRSFSEGASAKCPRCNCTAERVFAPVPILFKGSGFYVTDYRKEKAPSEEKPAPAVTKAESKPEKAAGSTATASKN
ncbi:MAG TPA: FmdB family zinc ribbon protein [Dehalococcoidales bacterium]